MGGLEERFELGKLIGAGGIGIVHEATDRLLERKVAIKILNQKSAGNEERVQRFLREMKFAAKLVSPHAVKVLEVGRSDGGDPYMVMELLEGESLGSAASRGPVPAEKAASWIAQACRALEEAHAKGFVHRDAKLDNMFLAKMPDGAEMVKVLDFGLARGLRRAGSEATLTPTDVVLGSPRYMSPEQLVAARDVDPRTDVWALGVCLYRLVSGRFPFPAGTFGELCAEVMSKPVPDIAAPLPVQRVILRCLSREVGKRYADAGELRVALERALAGDVADDVATSDPSSTSAATTPVLLPTAAPAAPRGLSRHAIWLVVPAVVSAAVVVLRLTQPNEPAASREPSTAAAGKAGVDPLPAASTPSGPPGEAAAVPSSSSSSSSAATSEPSPTSSHKRRPPRKPSNGLFNTER